MRRLPTQFAVIAAASGLVLAAAGGSPARADGWYFGAETGINYVPALNIPNTVAAANPTKLDSTLGMGILGQVGYAWDMLRVEGELGWRTNGVDHVSTANGPFTNGSGDLVPLSAMANIYIDIPTGSKFVPFVGVGVGGVDVQTRIAQAGTTLVDDSATTFGYQGIVGASYVINDQLSIKADYRYLGTTAADLADKTVAGTARETYSSHSVMVGFIYHFGFEPAPKAPEPAAAPPPPPPPPPPPKPAAAATPAPQVQHQFMVFFDWDKSDITPEAQVIIEQAATAAKTAGSARIDLAGHTDTSGPAAYNLRLSVRRGDAVKKALVGMGFKPDEISVVGKGETDLLVPTPDGVREPKNRRVVIVIE